MNFSKTRVRVGVGRQLAAAHAKTSVADRANTLNKEMQGRLLKNMFGCAYLFVEQAFLKFQYLKSEWANSEPRHMQRHLWRIETAPYIWKNRGACSKNRLHRWHARYTNAMRRQFFVWAGALTFQYWRSEWADSESRHMQRYLWRTHPAF